MLPRLSGSNLQQIQFRAARLHCGALARSLCEFVCECQSEWQTQRRREREREEGRVRLVVFLLRRFCSSSIRIAFQYINIYTQVNLHTAEKRIRRSHSCVTVAVTVTVAVAVTVDVRSTPRSLTN